MLRGSGRTRALVMALPEGGATVVVHTASMRGYVRQMIHDFRGCSLQQRTDIVMVRYPEDIQNVHGRRRPIMVDHAVAEVAHPQVFEQLVAMGVQYFCSDYIATSFEPRRSYSFGPSMTEQEIVQFPAGTIGLMAEEMAAAVDRVTEATFCGIDLAAGEDLTAVWYRDVLVRTAEQLEPMLVRTRLPEASWRMLHEGAWSRSTTIDPDTIAESKAAAEAAEAKAEQLLRDWLTPQQLESYDKDRRFEVTGAHTGMRYRINHGRAYNISELDADGASVCDWCFGPEGDLAAGDCMLAQKIALETDELAALKVANRRESGGGIRIHGNYAEIDGALSLQVYGRALGAMWDFSAAPIRRDVGVVAAPTS